MRTAARRRADPCTSGGPRRPAGLERQAAARRVARASRSARTVGPWLVTWTMAALCSACGTIGAPTFSPPPVRPGSMDDMAGIRRAEAASDLAGPGLRTAARHGQAGGVFVRESAWSLTSDSRAFRPGDVVTVLLQETTQASKKADTSFGKSGKVSVDPSVLLGNALSRTAVGLGASRDFAGSSSSTQQNTLQGAITVVVQEVMPNGLLRIEGEKTLTLNQGEEFVRVTGFARAADIDADNRVSSQRIANARIAYAGQGALADANSGGWLMRFFTSPWMPF